jgi:uncharacterized protein
MSEYRGRFLWLELMTNDVDAAKAFYTETLGWGTQTMQSSGGPPYTMFTAASGPVGGVWSLSEEERAQGVPPHWRAYIGTPDVDAATQKAVDAGGRVLMKAMDIPGIGRMSVVTDPHGAAFGPYTPHEWPGTPLARAQVGEFSWHELMSGSFDEAWKLYQSLFGWNETGNFDMGPMGVYHLYGIGEHALGGMMTKTADMPMAYWLHYVRVDDMDAAIERIKARGGTIMHGPMVVPGGDVVAQCMDPQGAMFAVHSSKQ